MQNMDELTKESLGREQIISNKNKMATWWRPDLILEIRFDSGDQI